MNGFRKNTAPTRKQPGVIGLLEWFRLGEHERVERILDDLKTLGVKDLRTGFSWADWHRPEGREWYAWLFPLLARHVNVLPSFAYTPPSLGIRPKTSSPPRNPKDYADFLDVMVTRFGAHFEWMELWNEPNNRREWDFTLDPDWKIFSTMITGAAHLMKSRGKKTVLGGCSPIDPGWVRMICERDVMDNFDAIGVHAFPSTYEFTWEGWEYNITRVRTVLDKYESNAEIWVTGTGYSTGRHDEIRQVVAFREALDAPAERLYWYSIQDLDPSLAIVCGFHSDEKEYHFGLKHSDGSVKLLYRLWASEGPAGARGADWMASPPARPQGARPVLITGGAGFIGTNLAHRLASDGRPVLVYDNLSRIGAERNLEWLKETHGDLVQVIVADVLDVHGLRKAAAEACQVFHFAAQGSFTTSLQNPIRDFEVNAQGTLNLLEALRSLKRPPPLVFTSTNMVYGTLEDVQLETYGSRYRPINTDLRSQGISENRPLDFRTPYGCSKGAADLYILDYARTFHLPAVVFRMSCIYGPHQFGTEDQGWLAHFLITSLAGKPLVLYGDGRQVRDVLFVDDLVEAMLIGQVRMRDISGQAFNVGGGPSNTISLLEMVNMIAGLRGEKPAFSFQDPRPGNQKYYVSDTRKFQSATGWKPKVKAAQGVERLERWLEENRNRGLNPLRGSAEAGLASPIASRAGGKKVAV